MVRGQRGRSVLIVEDEPLIRALIAGEFAADDWEVFEVGTGAEVLDLIARHRIDILFTDIQLGAGLNGWDIAEALRRSRDDLPVIYTSGNATDRTRQVPNSLFFDKPYDANEVVMASAKLIDRSA